MTENLPLHRQSMQQKLYWSMKGPFYLCVLVKSNFIRILRPLSSLTSSKICPYELEGIHKPEDILCKAVVLAAVPLVF